MLQAMANLLSPKPKQSSHMEAKMHGCSDEGKSIKSETIAR